MFTRHGRGGSEQVLSAIYSDDLTRLSNWQVAEQILQVT